MAASEYDVTRSQANSWVGTGCLKLARHLRLGLGLGSGSGLGAPLAGHACV